MKYHQSHHHAHPSTPYEAAKEQEKEKMNESLRRQTKITPVYFLGTSFHAR